MSLYDFFSTSTYLVPGTARVDEVPPDDVDSWWSWAHGLGGEPVGQVRLVVTIQLLIDRAVVVDEPRVVKRRVEDPDGIEVRPSPMGGAGFWPRIHQFDLTASGARPSVMNEALEHAPSNFKLTRDDTERVDILCRADQGSWEWTVTLPVIVDGRRHELTIDDDGRPFRTVSSAKATSSQTWSSTLHRWENTSP